MQKIFYRATLSATFFLIAAQKVLAGSPTPSAKPSTEDVFGTIDVPEGVAKYNTAAGEGGIGLIVFISTLIRIATILAGVWVMFNFILAGWTYITSNGEAKTHADVAQKLTFSVVGLVLIVGAYTLAALIGLILFGNASYILNPTLQGVTTGVPGT